MADHYQRVEEMGQVRDYRKIQAWEKAHAVVLDVYRVTAHFPREEMFGLTSQIRRSAASVPSNIAEGCGRGGESELARFLTYSQGSNMELDYQLLLARDLNLLEPAEFSDLSHRVDEVGRMISGYIASLRR